MTTRTVRLIDHPPHRPPNLGRLLRNAVNFTVERIGQWLSPSYEPTIVEGSDRYGNPYWEVYDPNTQRTMYCTSETEVMQWLDQSA